MNISLLRLSEINLSTFWANSADDKRVVVFLYFPENRLCYFTQGDSLHEMSKLIFLNKNEENILKYRLLTCFFSMRNVNLLTQDFPGNKSGKIH